MQLRVKNSSTWFSCKNCPSIFPLKVLLTLHEKQEHFVLVVAEDKEKKQELKKKEDRKGKIKKKQPVNNNKKDQLTRKRTSRKAQKEDKMPGLIGGGGVEKKSISTNFEHDDCTPLKNLKRVKRSSADHMCQKKGIDITTCSVTLEPLSPHEEAMFLNKNGRKIASSSSSPTYSSRDEVLEDNRSSSASSQAGSETTPIDLDSSSTSSSPNCCNTNDPSSSASSLSSGSSSSTFDLNSKTEPKAEPCANFLDHVTTCLSGKKRPTYRCNFCGQDLQTVSQVKEHIPLHIGHFGFPCDRPNCPKSFASRYDQLRHQARHLRKEQKSQKAAMIRATLSSPQSQSTLPSSSSLGPQTGQKEPPAPAPPQAQALPSKSFDDLEDPLKSYLTRYCLCNQIEYGDMVACDRRDCPKEWFHFQCVGLTKAPRGPWRCPPCRSRTKRKRARHY